MALEADGSQKCGVPSSSPSSPSSPSSSSSKKDDKKEVKKDACGCEIKPEPSCCHNGKGQKKKPSVPHPDTFKFVNNDEKAQLYPTDPPVPPGESVKEVVPSKDNTRPRLNPLALQKEEKKTESQSSTVNGVRSQDNVPSSQPKPNANKPTTTSVPSKKADDKKTQPAAASSSSSSKKPTDDKNKKVEEKKGDTKGSSVKTSVVGAIANLAKSLTNKADAMNLGISSDTSKAEEKKEEPKKEEVKKEEPKKEQAKKEEPKKEEQKKEEPKKEEAKKEEEKKDDKKKEEDDKVELIPKDKKSDPAANQIRETKSIKAAVSRANAPPSPDNLAHTSEYEVPQVYGRWIINSTALDMIMTNSSHLFALEIPPTDDEDDDDDESADESLASKGVSEEGEKMIEKITAERDGAIKAEEEAKADFNTLQNAVNKAKAEAKSKEETQKVKEAKKKQEEEEKREKDLQKKIKITIGLRKAAIEAKKAEKAVRTQAGAKVRTAFLSLKQIHENNKKQAAKLKKPVTMSQNEFNLIRGQFDQAVSVGKHYQSLTNVSLSLAIQHKDAAKETGNVKLVQDSHHMLRSYNAHMTNGRVWVQNIIRARNKVVMEFNRGKRSIQVKQTRSIRARGLSLWNKYRAVQRRFVISYRTGLVNVKNARKEKNKGRKIQFSNLAVRHLTVATSLGTAALNVLRDAFKQFQRYKGLSQRFNIRQFVADGDRLGNMAGKTLISFSKTNDQSVVRRDAEMEYLNTLMGHKIANDITVLSPTYLPKYRGVLAKAEEVDPSAEYTMMFWVKPNRVYNNWGGLFQKGKNGRARSPAVWFYPKQTRLHIRSSSTTGWNWGQDPGQKLPLNQWTHVAFSHKKGQFRVYLNGRMVINTNGNRVPQPTRNTDDLFSTGHPFAIVADLRYASRIVPPRTISRVYMMKKFDGQISQGFVPRANRVIAPHSALPPTSSYTFAFWVNPKRALPVWRNLFIKGRGRSRSIGVWFYPGTTRLHIRSSTPSSWNFGSDPNIKLPLNKWTHVVVMHRAGLYRIYFNGRIVVNKKGKGVQPPRRNNYPLWNEGRYPASAVIADLVYSPELMSTASVRRLMNARQYGMTVLKKLSIGYVPRKRQLIARSNTMPNSGEFTMMFWIKPKARRGGWSNIMARTIGNNRSRQPSVWFYPGRTRLHIRSSTAKQWNFGINSPRDLPINRWTHVAFSHKAGEYRVYYNGKMVVNKRSKSIQAPSPCKNCHLWGGDRFHNPSLAQIMDVRFAPAVLSNRDIQSVIDQKAFTAPLPVLRSAMLSQHKRLVHANRFPRKIRSYSLSFWLRVTHTHPIWTAVMQKGRRGKSRMRSPGIFLYPNQNRLHFRSSTRRSWNWGQDPGARIPINKWFHVAVTHGPGVFRVFYNGRVVVNRVGKSVPPPLFNNDHLYASVDGLAVAPGMVSDIRYGEGIFNTAMVRSIMKEKRIVNNPIPTQFLGPSQEISRSYSKTACPKSVAYTFTFWVNIEKTNKKPVYILQRGNTLNIRVMIVPGTTRLQIISRSQKRGNHVVTPGPAVPIGRWVNVAVIHGERKLEIYYNGRAVYRNRGRGIGYPYFHIPNRYALRVDWSNSRAAVEVADVRLYPLVLNSGELRKVIRDRAMLNTVQLASQYMPRRGVTLASSSKMEYKNAYSLSFFVRPTGRTKMFSGLFSRRNGMSVGFHPGTTWLRVYSSTKRSKNFNALVRRNVPLFRWTHIAITHKDRDFRVYYNGGLVYRTRSTATIGVNLPSVNLMSGFGDAHPSAVANLYFSSVVLSGSEIKLLRTERPTFNLPKPIRAVSWAHTGGKKVVTSSFINSYAYSFSFWVKVTRVNKGWTLVFQRSERRALGVWVVPGSTRLHIRCHTQRSWNDGGDPAPPLGLNSWTHVSVSVFYGSWVVLYNGRVVLKKRIDQPVLPKDQRRLTVTSNRGATLVSDLRYYPVGMSIREQSRLYKEDTFLQSYLVSSVASPIRGKVLRKSPSLQYSNQLTLSFWLYPTSSAPGTRYLLEKGSSLMAYMNRNRIYFRSRSSSSSSFTLGGRGLPLNRWTHITFTHRSNDARIYFNGNLAQRRAGRGAGTPRVQNSALTSSRTNSPYPGLVQSLVFAPKYFNHAQIRQLANTRPPFVSFSYADQTILNRKPVNVRRFSKTVTGENTGSYTLSFWVRRTGGVKRTTKLFYSNTGVYAYLRKDQRLQLRGYNGRASTLVPSPTLALNRWVQVTMVQTRYDYSVYYNGRRVSRRHAGYIPNSRYGRRTKYYFDPSKQKPPMQMRQMTYSRLALSYGNVRGQFNQQRRYIK